MPTNADYAGTRQRAFDESLPFEGDASGLREHLISVHGLAALPLAGSDQGSWLRLANLHADAHLGVRDTEKMRLNPEPLATVALPICRKCGRTWGMHGKCVCLDPDLSPNDRSKA